MAAAPASDVDVDDASFEMSDADDAPFDVSSDGSSDDETTENEEEKEDEEKEDEDEEEKEDDDARMEGPNMAESAQNTCPKCAETKPLTAFSKGTETPSGYKTWCKNCSAVQHEEYVNTDEGFLRNMVSHMQQRRATCAHDYESMAALFANQGRGCSISELPIVLRKGCDWQASPGLIDHTIDYELTNTRICALEFNSQFSWSRADLALFYDLSTAVMSANDLQARMNSTAPPKSRRSRRPAQRRTVMGRTQWHCNHCNQFKDENAMRTGTGKALNRTICWLCHYKQKRENRRQKKKPIARKWARSHKTADGTVLFTCNFCEQDKPKSDMWSKTECSECSNARATASVFHELDCLLRGAKKRTERRNRKIAKRGGTTFLACTITLAQLIAMYIAQMTRCGYSNVPFQHRSLLRPGEVMNQLRKMSLERKNPRLGYTADNCCLICVGFNSTDNTCKYKWTAVTGSGAWSKLKWAFMSRWLTERRAGATVPSISWADFKAEQDVEW